MGWAVERIALKIIRTSGDTIQDRPLAEAGGKGLFTKEIDIALVAGEIDAAVHSAKDLPTLLPDGVALAGFLPREDVRDALISAAASSIESLPRGASLGAASLRRQAQALRLRPDLRLELLRGNVETRLRKAEFGRDRGDAAGHGRAQASRPCPSRPRAAEPRSLPSGGRTGGDRADRAQAATAGRSTALGGDRRRADLRRARRRARLSWPSSKARAGRRSRVSRASPRAAFDFRGEVLRTDGSERFDIEAEGDGGRRRGTRERRPDGRSRRDCPTAF